MVNLSDQQKINDLLEQLRLSKIEQEPSSDIYKETLVGKKARLKESAKEYEEILGDGIKKDSILSNIKIVESLESMKDSDLIIEANSKIIVLGKSEQIQHLNSLYNI